MSDAYNYAIDNNYANQPQLLGKKYAVLITDGQPTIQTGCMGTGAESSPVDLLPVPQSITGALNSPSGGSATKTFVIGSPGSEEQSLTGADGRSLLSAAALAGAQPPTSSNLQ